MPYTSNNENILIQRAIAGDADAFGVLYEQYMDAIYRYVYFRLGNEEDAQDLTEHVFLKAWEKLPGYVSQGHRFSSWLYRIAHNALVDHYRKEKQVISTDFENGNWESEQSTALDSVIKAEETRALAIAIAQLPDDQQQVVILRFIEGLEHADVADIIDKSQGACRVIQHRALNALHKILSGFGKS